MNLKVIQIGALRFFVHIETVYGGTLNLYLKGIALIRINNSGVHVLSAWQLLQISRFIRYIVFFFSLDMTQNTYSRNINIS